MKLFASLLLLIAFMASMENITAKDVQCTSSSECSTRYCRFGVCTTWGQNEGEDGRENPCNLTDCANGFSCVIMQVSCFTAPCPGAAHCTPNSEK